MTYSLKAWLVLLFLALVWGSSFILMKTGLTGLAPLQVAGLRLVTASICLLPFAIIAFKKMPKKLYPAFFFAGLFGNVIPAFLFPMAQTVVSSAVSGILNSLSPVFILLIALVIFRRKIAIHRIIGIAIGLTGAVILVLSKDESIDFSQNAGFSLLIVLATFFYGISANIIGEYFKDINPISATAMSLLFAGLPSGIILMFSSDVVGTVSMETFPWKAFWAVILLGSVGTALAVALFTKLVQMTDVVFGSSVTYIMPVVALGWGFAAKESVQLLQIVGLVVIISGVYLINYKKKTGQ